MRFEIRFLIEQDSDYSNDNQVEMLRTEIENLIADYNCFYRIGCVVVDEVN
jgi:hypothetical protein